MRKLLLVITSLFLTTIVAMATKWSATNLPMEYLRDYRQMVCNPDGVMSAAAVDSTNQMLLSLKKENGIQAIVVVVKQIEGDDPYQFAMELGKKYGIGDKKQNSGLIVVLATEDRSYQILTGNGLEGALPDAICRRIQNQVMLPELKAGNWDAAIIKTMVAIKAYLNNDKSLLADDDANDDIVTMWSILGGAIAFVIIIAIIYIVQQQKYKCPTCHKKMRLVKQDKVRITNTGIYKLRAIYRCPRCGKERIFYTDTDNINNSGSVPPIIFSSSLGGSSSGGFSGGTFGGGTFGGGGSGGRF